jgi:hypothetical protein
MCQIFLSPEIDSSSFGFDSESYIILWFGVTIAFCNRRFVLGALPLGFQNNLQFADLLLFTLLAWTKGMQRGLNR